MSQEELEMKVPEARPCSTMTNGSLTSLGERRHGAQAKSVLRLAGDILQARSAGARPVSRSLQRHNRLQQKLLRSASEQLGAHIEAL